MQLNKWGEDSFISYIQNLFLQSESNIGIGDDCAVIPRDKGWAWLITTDALVEGVHFLKDQVKPRDLGYKTLAVNISDIAAMGGDPKYAFLSVALPKTVESQWMRHMIEGLKDACDKWNVQLLGGDTVGSQRDIFLNLTLVGTAESDKIKYRHQAQVGDIVCVTRYLGDSGGGLKALQEQIRKSKEVKHLINAHFRPEPSPQQGKWLASHPHVHAMMDISDGLNCDLRRLLRSSQKGASIDISKIPLSQELLKVCTKYGWDILELAFVGGEDYCLLLTISAEWFDRFQQNYKKKFGIPLYEIGRITQQPQQLIYHNQGEVVRLRYSNFDHFQ